MMNRTDIMARLGVLLDAHAHHDGLAYPVQMWRYALRALDEEIRPHAQCDAIPYLPVDPAAFGVTLTADSRVLDIGCLGGYGLYDLAWRRRRQGLPVPHLTGVDIDPASVGMSRELAALWSPDLGAEVAFDHMSAEELHVADGTFDLVICRLVLPYTDVRRALSEMSRVLKPAGALLLQVHAPAYYGKQLLRARSLKAAVYYARPLLVGLIFGLTGHQWRRHDGRAFETSIPNRVLRREARRAGLSIRRKFGGSAKPLAILQPERIP